MISAVAAWAAAPSSTLEGIVKDPKGQAVGGAEIHVTPKGGGTPKIVRSDASGHYICTGLPVGTYEVVLFVNGSIKAGINNTTTLANKPTQLNFALTGKITAITPAKKHTHMVYMPPGTGSHLGGRWVEVDDNGDGATAGAEHADNVSGDAIRHMQANPGGGTGGGGH